jgi:hypothetical protein
VKLRTAILLGIAALVVELLGARALDALGLIERLLSPHGVSLLLVVPLALVFYAARFTLLFVAPGLLLSAALLTVVPRAKRRAAAPGA